VVLVDTHVVVWLAFQEEKVSKAAKLAIRMARREAQGLAICGFTLMELAMLLGKGRIHVGAGLESFLRDVESRFIVLPITAKTCAQSIHLPPTYPKDPADRIIGATAIANGIPLITADRAIRDSQAVTTIW
jgi:PIN domain nuclease of toxin-antitoxin system